MECATSDNIRQQILKMVSFYTATDPETSFSFARRLIDNGLLHAAIQHFDQALLQFINIIHRLRYTCPGLPVASFIYALRHGCGVNQINC